MPKTPHSSSNKHRRHAHPYDVRQTRTSTDNSAGRTPAHRRIFIALASTPPIVVCKIVHDGDTQTPRHQQCKGDAMQVDSDATTPVSSHVELCQRPPQAPLFGPAQPDLIEAMEGLTL